MIKYFQQASLKRKQTLLIALTSGVAVLLACVAFAACELISFRGSMVQHLSTLAGLIGNNATAGLDFNDRGSVAETLGSLQAERNIIGAAVYGRDGRVFAKYERRGTGSRFVPPVVQPVGHEFKNGALTVFGPIRQKGEAIGTVCVQSDLQPLYERLREYGVIMLSVFSLCVLIAFVLSAQLQQFISNPIIHLVRTARKVAREKNYSMRASKQSNDELGILVDSFNEMLAEIQDRDAELLQAKEVLERRVAERTEDLAGANIALQEENAERQRAENNVRKTEALYRRAIAGADAVPYAYDYQTRSYLFIGEGIERLLGYGGNEICPQLWNGIVQESIMLGETAGLSKEEAIQRVVRGELRNWRCDMRVLTRYGQTRWISDSSVQNLDERGRPTGSMGILQDITERKQAEESLRLLSSALDQSADTVVITDVEGRIKHVNPAFLLLTGYEREDVLGQTPRILKSGQHPQKFYEELWTTLYAGETFRGEFTNRKKNGELFYEEKTITPVTDSSGRITHFVATGRDTTARKQVEEKMQFLQKELVMSSRQAGMAEVATGVLHNVGNVLNSVNVTATVVDEQIRKSRATDLGAVVQLMGEHATDLAGFLTAHPKGKRIPDFLGLLAAQLASERKLVLEEMTGLRKNIEHIKDIVAMQQSYARVSGVIEKVDPRELMEDTLRMNTAALQRHNITVVRDFRPAPPVDTDKHKVLQILVNLVRNAKYACAEATRPDKQIIARVRAENGRLKFTIIDNGVGIPPENLTRIFNHGFTTRRDGHGFGLHSGALAARELGGALTVQSVGVGEGAIFTLELPCTEIKVAPPREALLETNLAHA